MPALNSWSPVAVAGRAGHHHDFLAAVGQPRALEPDVLELHLHRRAGVQLQGQDAAGGPLVGLVVDDLGRHLAVDLVDQVIALGDDLVFVPVFLLDVRLQRLGVGHLLGVFLAVARRS